MLDGVGVGISVDMTYETPGSTHENIGCTAKGVTYVASCLTTPTCCMPASVGLDLVISPPPAAVSLRLCLGSELACSTTSSELIDCARDANAGTRT